MKKEIKDIEDIRLLVDNFYIRVRKDELLAPIFVDRIPDWQKHMETLYTFWQSVLLGQQTYQGVPFPKHSDLPLTHQHFDRWLSLFHQTVDDLFMGPVAEDARFRAIKISEVFRYKMELTSF